MSIPADPMNLSAIRRRSVIVTTFRLLTFRASRAELIQLTSKHLYFGLLSTWLVGIGRYWDNPRASLLQHLGIGSMIYIFLLSLLLWLVIWPLRPKQWSYLKLFLPILLCYLAMAVSKFEIFRGKRMREL